MHDFRAKNIAQHGRISTIDHIIVDRVDITLTAGSIYEKDLGSRTAAIASGMTSFDPDDTWRRLTQAVQSASGRR